MFNFYYKFNVYFDQNICMYFCLKFLTSILGYSNFFLIGTISSHNIFVFFSFFNLIIHMWIILSYEIKVHNIPTFYFNNDVYIIFF